VHLLNVLEVLSRWAIPILLLAISTIGVFRKIPVYESFVEGAKEGFATAVRLIPFLVAMFVAIQIFRQSGAMDGFIGLMSPITKLLGIPKEIMPLALIRPLSGSGALGILSNILETYGPDSFLGRLASTVQGSTETTFYVITVYFGAIGVRRVRHSLIAGLAADVTGFLVAVYIVSKVFG